MNTVRATKGRKLIKRDDRQHYFLCDHGVRIVRLAEKPQEDAVIKAEFTHSKRNSGERRSELRLTQEFPDGPERVRARTCHVPCELVFQDAKSLWVELMARLLDVRGIVADRERMIETQDGAFTRSVQGQVLPEVLWIFAPTDSVDEFGRPPGAGGGTVCAVVRHDQARQGGLPSFPAARQGGIY